jgi:hypothetical protein
MYLKVFVYIVVINLFTFFYYIYSVLDQVNDLNLSFEFLERLLKHSENFQNKLIIKNYFSENNTESMEYETELNKSLKTHYYSFFSSISELFYLFIPLFKFLMPFCSTHVSFEHFQFFLLSVPFKSISEIILSSYFPSSPSFLTKLQSATSITLPIKDFQFYLFFDVMIKEKLGEKSENSSCLPDHYFSLSIFLQHVFSNSELRFSFCLMDFFWLIKSLLHCFFPSSFFHKIYDDILFDNENNFLYLPFPNCIDESGSSDYSTSQSFLFLQLNNPNSLLNLLLKKYLCKTQIENMLLFEDEIKKDCLLDEKKDIFYQPFSYSYLKDNRNKPNINLTLPREIVLDETSLFTILAILHIILRVIFSFKYYKLDISYKQNLHFNAVNNKKNYFSNYLSFYIPLITPCYESTEVITNVESSVLLSNNSFTYDYFFSIFTFLLRLLFSSKLLLIHSDSSHIDPLKRFFDSYTCSNVYLSSHVLLFILEVIYSEYNFGFFFFF